MSSFLRVGFIGLGLMGTGMVMNLIKTGHQVTVWNRTAEKVSLFLVWYWNWNTEEKDRWNTEEEVRSLPVQDGNLVLVKIYSARWNILILGGAAQCYSVWAHSRISQQVVCFSDSGEIIVWGSLFVNFELLQVKALFSALVS